MNAVEKLNQSWRRVLKPPALLPIDEWCKRNIVLPPGKTAIPGPIDFDHTPFAREILRCAQDRNVSLVTLCTGTQISKSTILHCVAFWHAIENPKPIILSLSTREIASDVGVEKLDPIVECSPILKRNKREGKNDWTRRLKRFKASTLTLIGAGHSASSSESRSCGLLLADEVQRYKAGTQGEAGTLALVKNRVKGWPGAQVWQCGSPTYEEIPPYSEWLLGSQEHFHVQCPHCEHFQQLVFAHDYLTHDYAICWDRDAKLPDGKWDIEKVKASTYYKCAAKGCRIEQHEKFSMLLTGKWIADNPTSKSHRSFHLNSLYSNFLSWSEVAAVFCRADSPEGLKDFRTNYLAEPWVLQERSADQQKLADKQDEYEWRTFPEAVALFMTVDVQRDGCWFVVRAWSSNLKSYLVDFGHLPSLEAVAEFSKTTFQDRKIDHVFVDSGDRTDEVMEFCKQNCFYPTKGMHSINTGEMFKWSKNIYGLLLINTTACKDALSDRIAGKDWHIFKSTSHPLDEYYRQMSAERPEWKENKTTHFKQRVWVRRHDRNHLWDCEVASYCAALAFDIRNAAPPVQVQETPASKPPEPQRQPQSIAGTWWDKDR